MERLMDQKHRGAYNELVAALWLMNQGYEVFRNVSAHGLIDIVAFRDGEMTKFDVKTVANGRSPVRLNDKQIAAGVKWIKVYQDGTCQIGDTPAKEPIPCKGCGTMFIRRFNDSHQIFCSKSCRKIHDSDKAKQNYKVWYPKLKAQRQAAKIKNLA